MPTEVSKYFSWDEGVFRCSISIIYQNLYLYQGLDTYIGKQGFGNHVKNSCKSQINFPALDFILQFQEHICFFLLIYTALAKTKTAKTALV